MGYEIDFLAVEHGEKSGDAIAFRIGNLHGPPHEQFVGIIDAGYTEDGEKLVKHVRDYYGTNTVNVLVCSHPDDDHSSGLEPVVDLMDVELLMMHQPWNHANKIRNMFTNGRLTTRGLSDKFTRSLASARAVEQIALRKRVPIIEPFAVEGIFVGNRVYVAGPTRAFYQSLLCDFDCAPAVKSPIAAALSSYYGAGVGVLEAVKRKVEETWDIETLSDSCETSAENNSSTILLINAGDEFWLLTGDAGAPALTQAVNHLLAIGVDYSKIKFFQIPHHGSHHSVGPTVLNLMLGPKLPTDSPLTRTAFVSSAKVAPKHPSKKVTNAYRRRGLKVHATEGTPKVHWNDHPARPNWENSTPLPFYNEVEEE